MPQCTLTHCCVAPTDGHRPRSPEVGEPAGHRLVQGAGCCQQGNLLITSLSAQSTYDMSTWGPGRQHGFPAPSDSTVLQRFGTSRCCVLQVFSLTDAELSRGLVACSSGNFAAALLHACAALQQQRPDRQVMRHVLASHLPNASRRC